MGALGQPIDSIGGALKGGAAEPLYRPPMYRDGGHQSPADDQPVEGQDQDEVPAGVPPAFDKPKRIKFEDSPQGRSGITDGIPKSPTGPIVAPPGRNPIGFKIKLAIAIIVIALIGA